MVLVLTPVCYVTPYPLASWSVIGLIPARGGSKSVKGKNLLSWDGRYPAVISAAKLAAPFCSQVFVTTDSPEIEAVAEAHGFQVLQRPAWLSDDKATIDQLIDHYQQELPDTDILVILPTAAGVIHDDIKLLIEVSEDRWAAALANRTHGLIYDQSDELLTPRINRQGQYFNKEVGVRYLPRGTNAFSYLPVYTPTIITEIDAPIDLMVARHRPKDIALIYDESPTIGTGHRRRMTAVANELQHHNVELLRLNEFDHEVRQPDVVVFDVLDTERYLVAEVAAYSKVLTIEDLGEGARYADATINALYDPAQTKYVDLRPEFWGLRHSEYAADRTNVLVTFGGTDPANLGMRFSGALLGYHEDRLHITTVTPQSPINMARAMMGSHIVITSAGRTLHEAAYLGVPTISIAANIRETTHCHLGPKWGNVYLGHHEEVSDEQFIKAFDQLMTSSSWRKELVSNRYLDHLGVQRIAKLAERLAED